VRRVGRLDWWERLCLLIRSGAPPRFKQTYLGNLSSCPFSGIRVSRNVFAGADWVVKLIDVYPDQVAADPAMGGYQLMVSGDIFRGRYRESFETPKPIPSGEPLTYRFATPTANHVFLPGHRIMVQVQLSWFPLHDRNPQTFVPNIFWAKPPDYKRAVQRIYHASGQASFVELPLVVSP